MKEIEKHENLKRCAIYSYGKNNHMPNGYELIGLFSNDRNGLQASVIKHEKEIIISFRGTNFELSREGLNDAKNDYQMWKRKFPEQANSALQVYYNIHQQYPNAEIILTGHSLGGSLAQIVGALYDVETVTFNAYGVKDVIKTNQAIYPDKITNYVNLNDYNFMIKNTGNQIGTCYSVNSKSGVENNHKAESMLPLSTRKRFDQKDYAKSSRHKSLGLKEIHTGNNQCKGIYNVSGYTRSDGTKVKSYTRECYIHGSNVLNSFYGKSVGEMSQSEIDELLDDVI